MKPRTRLLGIDFGTVRIGLAVSDSECRIASPLEQYRRAGRDRDLQFFRQLVEREEIGSYVIGLPIHLAARRRKGQGGPSLCRLASRSHWLGRGVLG